MQAQIRTVRGTPSRRMVVMTMLAVVGLILPVVLLGAAPAEAATVAVSLDCGPYDGTTFPIEDVTVAQGDTIEVTWDSECIHPILDHTVLQTDGDVAGTYFSAVPGQGSGPSDGFYRATVPGSSSGTWVLRYDAPLGRMPLNTNMDDSWPSACSNCAEGSAIRLTVTPGPTVPEAPAAPIGTPGDGSVALNWSAPGDDGGSPVTGYKVTALPGGATCTTTAPTTSCAISGLTNGEAYRFKVLAVNAVGDGPESESSATITPPTAATRSTSTTTSTTTPTMTPTPTTTSTPTATSQPRLESQPVPAALRFTG